MVPELGGVPTRMLDLQGGGLYPTSVGEENETFLTRVWKPLLSKTRFKIVRPTAIRNGPKWTIFASGGLGLLQMVSELHTERCASVDTGPQRG